MSPGMSIFKKLMIFTIWGKNEKLGIKRQVSHSFLYFLPKILFIFPLKFFFPFQKKNLKKGWGMIFQENSPLHFY